VGIRLTPSGGWADIGSEDRALGAPTVQPGLLPYSDSAPLTVTTSNALRISDAWACVRVLADSISTLPLHVYRRTAQGRVPAGDNARAVQLLRRPSPGSTGVDLISTTMVHLAVYGESFWGLYRSDGEIVQLGCISPESVEVELRGQRIVYTLSTQHGLVEVGPDDVLHIKGMSMDGLRGMSPVTQCRLSLGLSASLQESARQYFANGSKPTGVLTVAGGKSDDAVKRISTAWNTRHAGVTNMHRVAVVSGDITFTPVAFSAQDSEFLGQRELSTREIARCWRVPAWAIEGATGDSLTYSNVLEQSRALATYTLRPWATRIEKAISNCAALCPGETYAAFDFDGLLRASPEQRAEAYTRALDPETGWLRRSEVRELEDLPPENEESP
jgi:HK97 family phage portal protein